MRQGLEKDARGGTFAVVFFFMQGILQLMLEN